MHGLGLLVWPFGSAFKQLVVALLEKLHFNNLLTWNLNSSAKLPAMLSAVSKFDIDHSTT